VVSFPRVSPPSPQSKDLSKSLPKAQSRDLSKAQSKNLFKSLPKALSRSKDLSKVPPKALSEGLSKALSLCLRLRPTLQAAVTSAPTPLQQFIPCTHNHPDVTHLTTHNGPYHRGRGSYLTTDHLWEWLIEACGSCSGTAGCW
jgi:hypothetical protein